MLKKIIYITGNSRSGSTVLDFLLGQHPLICSLGELHHLHKYVNVNYNVSVENDLESTNLVCSCGEILCNCLFWNKVENFLEKPLKDVNLILDSKRNIKNELNVNWFCNKKNLIIFKNKLASKFIKKNPSFLINKSIFCISGYKRVAIEHFKLCEAVSKATAKQYIVDSSKAPHRFQYLSMLDKEKLFIIHLVRNPAAVVYSMMNRGLSNKEAINHWCSTEKNINKLLKNIPHDKKILIRYEDLCKSPDEVLSTLCKKLNIKYDDKMEVLTIKNKHHIQGSPSKFKYNGRIVFDNKFLNKLSREQIIRILDSTLPFSVQYKYHERLRNE